MAAFAYATVGSNDLAKAKTFYDALLSLAGMEPFAEHQSGGRVYGSTNGPRFAVLAPHDGEAATAGNGSMFAFSFESRSEVDAFFEKALELGGTSEGSPGLRAINRYFAYFRDLDGNKICAFSVELD